jgi:ankyrin repeat protein
MVEAALAAGCEMDAKDNCGWSALELAASGGRVDVVRVLLDASADPDRPDARTLRTLLFHGAHTGHAAVLDLLLKRGADVTCVDDCELSLLHIAAQKGHADAVRILLDAGADANALSGVRASPLFFALLEGSRSCLEPLLQGGANFDDEMVEDARRRTEGDNHNESALRYMERVQAAGGYAQLVGTYRRVLTAPQSCLSWFLKFHCEFRFGLGAFPHDLVPLVLDFWKPPGGP